MKAYQFLLVAILAFFAAPTQTNAFVTDKKKKMTTARRANGFTPGSNTSNKSVEKYNAGNSNHRAHHHQVAAAASSTQQPAMNHLATTSTSTTTAFAFPPNNAMATTTALSEAYYNYDYEVDHYIDDADADDDDVSYGVALVACVLSLAAGFGTGYLV